MTAFRPFLERCLPVVVAVAGLTGCSRSSVTAPRHPLTAASAIITVNMREYSFDVVGPLPSGRVVFRMVNVSQETHSPSLVPLDESFPPIDAQIRGSVRRPIDELGKVNPVAPGHTATFAVDLSPGRRYALVCFARTSDGVRHAEKGMTWESRAGSGAGPHS